MYTPAERAMRVKKAAQSPTAPLGPPGRGLLCFLKKTARCRGLWEKGLWDGALQVGWTWLDLAQLACMVRAEALAYMTIFLNF